MSIQAGWNSALATLGRIAGAKKILGAEGAKLNRGISRNVNSAIDTMGPAIREANRTAQAQDLNFVGPMTPSQAVQRHNTVFSSDVFDEVQQDSGWGDPLMMGTPAGEAMMAAEQARNAAQAADMQPQNHGYMETLEQTLQSDEAPQDPMAELSRLTNSAMDEMNRQVVDSIHRIETGGNN